MKYFDFLCPPCSPSSHSLPVFTVSIQWRQKHPIDLFCKFTVTSGNFISTTNLRQPAHSKPKAWFWLSKGHVSVCNIQTEAGLHVDMFSFVFDAVCHVLAERGLNAGDWSRQKYMRRKGLGFVFFCCYRNSTINKPWKRKQNKNTSQEVWVITEAEDWGKMTKAATGSISLHTCVCILFLRWYLRGCYV